MGKAQWKIDYVRDFNAVLDSDIDTVDSPQVKYVVNIYRVYWKNARSTSIVLTASEVSKLAEKLKAKSVSKLVGKSFTTPEPVEGSTLQEIVSTYIKS